MIAKVDRGLKEAEFNYTGRLADRQTEDDYTTSNLMAVRTTSLNFVVWLKVCR